MTAQPGHHAHPFATIAVFHATIPMFTLPNGVHGREIVAWRYCAGEHRRPGR